MTVPETGHSVLGSNVSGCAAKALRRFFAGRRALDCKFRPPRLVAPSPPPPMRLSSVPPFRGLSPHAGRTLTAVNATFEQLAFDLFDSLLAQFAGGGGGDRVNVSFGGLRGGYVRLDSSGLSVHDYSYVPGVTMSAHVRPDAADDAPLVLRVGGAAAAHGTLSFGPGRITGTLGGQRVSVRADGGREGREAGAASVAADGRLAAAALRSPVSRATLRDAIARARRLAPAPLGTLPLPIVPPGALR